MLWEIAACPSTLMIGMAVKSNVKYFTKHQPSNTYYSFNLIWTDPYPYNNITAITSENCPGLDNDFVVVTAVE